jgi:hypothetical protein
MVSKKNTYLEFMLYLISKHIKHSQMKLKFYLLLTISTLLLSLNSCKKCKIIPPTYPATGLWIGTYTVNAIPSQGSLFYSFDVYPDGTILTKGLAGDGKTYYASGTWQLSAANIFTATIKSITAPNNGQAVTQSITTTFSNTGTMTNGTWIDSNNPNGAPNSGKFSTMQRVN